MPSRIGPITDRYQFCVDGRPAKPVRESWLHAADDAVRDGYGIWAQDAQGNQIVKLAANQGAEIVRVGTR